MNLWTALFGGQSQRRLASYARRAKAIGELEDELLDLSDAQLESASVQLRARVRQGVALDDVQVEAFALVREAARRALGLRAYDVQLVGGMALHDGLIAEMATGEGKTLVAAFPAYLNALAGRGVHVVTVNDYLAHRDCQWMGPVYRALGMSVAAVVEEMGATEAEELENRRAAYASDITYGTNHEIAFDYLRDNLATDSGDIVHRGFNFALVDEVDFVLIDEARTPLIISGPARDDVGHFERVDPIVRRLREGVHFVVEHHTRSASLTDIGLETVAKELGVGELCELDNIEWLHVVHQSVRAHGIYRRDVDYIVDDGRVCLVDEFTGRVSEDKRLSDGLHQAIEAKEKLQVEREDRTLAKVTYQTFFGRYEKLAGMTGTAQSERREFRQTYGRDVQAIPTHRPVARADHGDIIFDTMQDKHAAIVAEIERCRASGQPVLVGTTSVRESEAISSLLQGKGVPHELLNAKNHRAEALIIAQAGRLGAVTISTNMAGRGTDIALGGRVDPAQSADEADDAESSQAAKRHDAVAELGGLHVIGTARHESVRIDDQLRGRAGRQGDPGSSQLMISLDDQIWKKFGSRQIETMRSELERGGHQPGAPIEARSVRRALTALQKRVEDENAATRQHVFQYDLVIHHQRESIYAWRRSLLADDGFDPHELICDTLEDLLEQSPDSESLAQTLRAHFHADIAIPDAKESDPVEAMAARVHELLLARGGVWGAEVVHETGRSLLLEAIDIMWTEHLANLERVEDGIDLHGYVGMEPLVVWKQQAAAMWEEMHRTIRSRVITLWFSLGTRA